MCREPWVSRTEFDSKRRSRICQTADNERRERHIDTRETARRLILRVPGLVIAGFVIASASLCTAGEPVGNPADAAPASSSLRPAQAPAIENSEYSIIHLSLAGGGCSDPSRQHNAVGSARCPTSKFGFLHPFQRLKERWKYEVRPRWQRKFLGYPDEFCEPPLGMFLTAHTDAMIRSGKQSSLVLFQCDFLTNSVELSSSGVRKLNRIAEQFSHTSGTIVIEAVPGQSPLVESRRVAVAAWFSSRHFLIGSDQVVVQPLKPGGLNSQEVDALRQQLAPPARETSGVR